MLADLNIKNSENLKKKKKQLLHRGRNKTKTKH